MPKVWNTLVIECLNAIFRLICILPIANCHLSTDHLLNL